MDWTECHTFDLKYILYFVPDFSAFGDQSIYNDKISFKGEDISVSLPLPVHII